MRVVIADDHAFMQMGLRQAFGIASRDGRFGSFDIVGVASTGQEAISQVLELKPDLVCLDVSLPVVNGFEVARQIRLAHPTVKIIFVSMHEEGNYVRQGLEVGGNAYLSKRSDPSEFIRALGVVLGGRSYIGESIWKAAGIQPTETAVPVLTERQRDILQAVYEGLSIEKTAIRLGITRKTVEYHRGRLMRQWSLNNAVELYRFAVTQVGMQGVGQSVSF